VSKISKNICSFDNYGCVNIFAPE